MKKHDKRLDNLRDIDNSDEEINRRKSEGQIRKRRETNIRMLLETKLISVDAIDVAVDCAIKNAKKGRGSELNDLIKAAKGNEPQEIVTGGDLKIEVVKE